MKMNAAKIILSEIYYFSSSNWSDFVISLESNVNPIYTSQDTKTAANNQIISAPNLALNILVIQLSNFYDKTLIIWNKNTQILAWALQMHAIISILDLCGANFISLSLSNKLSRILEAVTFA